MKKYLILSLSLSLMTMLAFAQPKFTSKVKKGIFSVNTYDKDGNLLNQGTAFYVGENGDAVADYRIFKGAHKAVAVGADGKQADVEYVAGADGIYSLLRFRVNTKNSVALPLASAFQPMESELFVLNIAEKGKVQHEQAAVADTSLIQGKYAYYGLNKKLDDKMIGWPVFNKEGQLVGILHSAIGDKSYVLDIRFYETLKIEAIASSSAAIALDNIFMPKGLPETAEEALVYLYFKSQTATNEEYMDMVNRFVAAYPQNAEGYLRRATPLIDLLRFDEADRDLQQHLALTDDKAEGHFKVGSLIYDKLRLQPEPAYEAWTYDVAIQHMDKAIELNQGKAAGEEVQENARRYKVMKAQMLVNAERYDAAIALYEALNEGDGRSPSYYYAISMAREGRGDSISAVIEPLDSALALFGTPLPSEAANYIIRRGQLYANMGKYRQAVQDYNQFAYLLNNKVSAAFYYERSQIEVNGRMYEPALNDINKAIEMSPRTPLYHIEKASLTLRVNLLDDCISACEAAIALNPNIVDSYRILGYAQLQKEDKENARANLQKAIDMGDENAKKILDTYFK